MMPWDRFPAHALLLALVFCLEVACGSSETPERAPNVILILTDNHGAWTLGCYGNPDVRTPNIDRLAEEGVLFTRAFANNAVCSPTRASLLTGLMPSQHGVHRYLGSGAAQIGPKAYNMLEEFATLPSILTDAGYAAGLSGKWHLGDNLYPQEGFSYWVTKPHGGSRGFYDQEIIEDAEIRVEPTYLTEFWTEHGVRFIEQNRDKPFFLFLSYNGPYGLGSSMEEPIRNRHAEFYAQKEMPSFPQQAPHPWLFNYRDWMDRLDVRRKYAAEISGINDGVGRILETLDRLNLTEDTLVVFTGDQGLAGGHSGFWGMGDHTRPLTGFDWTMSIPLIFRHPRRIPPGQRSDHIVANYDLLPTLLSYLGLSDSLPQTPRLPGRDITETLQGKATPWDNSVFYEFENVRAVRTEEWKYIERIYQEPNELYDVVDDPGEENNLYGKDEVLEVQEELQKKLHAFFNRYADPQWDLWKGGKSKTDLITEKFFGLENPYRPSNYEPGPGEGIEAMQAARGGASGGPSSKVREYSRE